MTAKVYIFLIFSAAVLVSGPLVWAHGVSAPQNTTLHSPTQIGLPESKAGHGHERGTGHTKTEGALTRSQIADLVHDNQDRENFHSGVKFMVLTIFIFGMMALFFPKRPAVMAMSEENTPPVSKIV